MMLGTSRSRMKRMEKRRSVVWPNALRFYSAKCLLRIHWSLPDVRAEAIPYFKCWRNMSPTPTHSWCHVLQEVQKMSIRWLRHFKLWQSALVDLWRVFFPKKYSTKKIFGSIPLFQLTGHFFSTLKQIWNASHSLTTNIMSSRKEKYCWTKAIFLGKCSHEWWTLSTIWTHSHHSHLPPETTLHCRASSNQFSDFLCLDVSTQKMQESEFKTYFC